MQCTPCNTAAAAALLQNARNVLVSSSAGAECGMVAKLADLGLSRVLQQHKTHRTTQTVGESAVAP
jgi:hypothetical protein